MPELADVLKDYGREFIDRNSIPAYRLKAMNSITSCRTSHMGGHVYKCEKCSEVHIQYNSCRNRHCPKCQGDTAKEWVENRKEETLPVPYYHVIFTVPDILNPIILRNQKVMYDLMFKATSETLTELIADSKYVGGSAGFMSVLHTWGQNLMDHPHIHSYVAGGGLSRDENYWMDTKNEKYLIPVHVLSSVFRGKFMESFVKLYKSDKLKLVGEVEYLKDKVKFNKLKDKLYKKGWVVNARPPFSNADTVIEYLGRYLKRVAISNDRILKIDDDTVTFKWKDNRDNKDKLMTLDAVEFIRRFLLHILPDKFVKIRYYGFMSNSQRKGKLDKIRNILGYRITKIVAAPSEVKSDAEVVEYDISRSKEEKSWICPCCSEVMIKIREFMPVRASPVV